MFLTHIIFFCVIFKSISNFIITSIVLKKYIFLPFLFCVTVCFADIKNVTCISEDNDLKNQSFYIDFDKKIISMQDQRKIFDIKFSNNLVGFKKSLSIRNLDSLISKKPKYFIYELDMVSMNLYVSVSSKQTEKFKYFCKFKY